MVPKKIYLDSNVFISWFNEEIGFGVRPLFVDARDFFELLGKSSYLLVLSELFFDEVLKVAFCSKEDVVGLFSKLGVPVEIVSDYGIKVVNEFVNNPMKSASFKMW